MNGILGDGDAHIRRRTVVEIIGWESVAKKTEVVSVKWPVWVSQVEHLMRRKFRDILAR